MLFLVMAASCGPIWWEPLITSLQHHPFVKGSTEQPLVVEIGAHDHGDGDKDPAKFAVEQGYRALLFEPLPDTYARLHARYAKHPSVKTRNALVCDSPQPTTAAGADGRPTLCLGDGRYVPFYGVDMTNATGNFGTPTADARCVTGPLGMKKFTWITQLSSLSKQHILNHAYLFSRKLPESCEECSKRLGRQLPIRCLERVVSANILERRLPCACLAAELASETRVALLVVDAEGHDSNVLAQFPFDRIKPAAIVFEAKHLADDDFARVSLRLRALGYVCAWGRCSRSNPWSFWLHGGTYNAAGSLIFNGSERWHAWVAVDDAARARRDQGHRA
jgi:hypothetical protein